MKKEHWTTTLAQNTMARIETARASGAGICTLLGMALGALAIIAAPHAVDRADAVDIVLRDGRLFGQPIADAEIRDMARKNSPLKLK